MQINKSTVTNIAKTLLQRRDQRKQLESFFVKAFSIIDPAVQLKNNWHISLIAEYLEACYQREIKNLIINIPPRFMKSNLTTVVFPAWVLGKDPAERFLCASYSNHLSTKHSVDTRTVIESTWYQNLFPETQLAGDQNEKTKFQTTKRGHRIATSVGGTATGEGGNFLILDDPVNPKMAMSKAEREKANNWMDQTWSTRKNDPNSSVEILVQQRLHTNDNTGHWLEKTDNIEHLSIEQEATKDKIFLFPRSGKVKQRLKGELIHPERVDQEQVDIFKKRLGSYGFASQQQQSPSPEGGGIIRIGWFGRYKIAPTQNQDAKITISVDSANKPNELNDPTVAGVFLTTGNKHYLLDLYRDRVIYPDLKRNLLNLFSKYKPHEIVIEDKASGQQLIQDFKTSTTWNIIPFDPTGKGDKLVRASNESPAIESGMVYLPESASWLFDFEQELQHFPNSEHDDQVDMLSQFLNRTRSQNEVYVG